MALPRPKIRFCLYKRHAHKCFKMKKQDFSVKSSHVKSVELKIIKLAEFLNF